jgi:hypothetical protein
MWKGQVVAVKVMKHQEDSRWAMRTAWELAVTKSLQHPNIVFVSADKLSETFAQLIERRQLFEFMA